MIVDFTFKTAYGTFSDALNLPDDQQFTDEQIEEMKQQRLNNWIAIITNPTLAEASEEQAE